MSLFCQIWNCLNHFDQKKYHQSKLCLISVCGLYKVLEKWLVFQLEINWRHGIDLQCWLAQTQQVPFCPCCTLLCYLQWFRLSAVSVDWINTALHHRSRIFSRRECGEKPFCVAHNGDEHRCLWELGTDLGLQFFMQWGCFNPSFTVPCPTPCSLL